MSVTRQLFIDLADNLTNNVFADFRQTFVIEELTKTPDGQGGSTTEWTTFATIQGFVKPTMGREVSQDERLKSEYERLFMFEYIPGITNDMRVSYDSKIYNIRKIMPVLDVNVWINLGCDEEVAT